MSVVSSLFIKKPSRLDALLMIMTLSLLVYSIAQRRMRANMEKANETIPNQINIPTATPNLRWVFQCFEGINFVQTEETYDKTNIYLDGFDKLRTKIINLIGGHSMHLYNIQKSSVGVCSMSVLLILIHLPHLPHSPHRNYQFYLTGYSFSSTHFRDFIAPENFIFYTVVGL